MPISDARRWDIRYQDDPRYDTFNRPRPFLVDHAHLLPESGLALDAAMGLGGNAGFLLEHGLRVLGLDISMVALRKAKHHYPGLMVVNADLTCFELPSACFDVILNFYYLQRELWPAYRRWLRPGGLMILETLTQDMLDVRPDTDPLYLLAPGELRQAFASWEILDYQEGWAKGRTQHPRAVASMAARKPE